MIISHHTPGPDPDRYRLLHERAQQLESRFLSEMLRHIGTAAPQDLFGGGPGEDQFSSFLRDAYAEALARRGGIGLAPHFLRSLTGRSDATV